jgi:hypothetical protein
MTVKLQRTMIESLLAGFHAAYPPDPLRVPFDATSHADAARRVPAPLLAEWQANGFGGYGGGFLWTPDPLQPCFDPADWRALDGSGIEILRSAFADLFVWQGGQVLWLNVLNGKATALTSNVELLFESTLLWKPFRADTLQERLFKTARKKHGALAPDECYGFAPLPALGGAMTAQHVVKVKLREYVALAAQVYR